MLLRAWLCTAKFMALIAPNATSGAPIPLYMPDTPSLKIMSFVMPRADVRAPAAPVACIRHLTVSMGWMTVRPTMPATCPDTAWTQGEGSRFSVLPVSDRDMVAAIPGCRTPVSC